VWDPSDELSVRVKEDWISPDIVGETVICKVQLEPGATGEVQLLLSWKSDRPVTGVVFRGNANHLQSLCIRFSIRNRDSGRVAGCSNPLISENDSRWGNRNSSGGPKAAQSDGLAS
jgi:hypothetical protein